MAERPVSRQLLGGVPDRIDLLIRRVGDLEAQLRDVLACLIELSDPDDDLAAECRRFLADLDR